MNCFETDITDDNHICIRCKQTISGLDNYIEHRKSGLCPHMSADQFFNSLQLQHKYKTVYESNEEEYEDEDRSVGSADNSDEEQSEEEVDIYRPPKDFTGGKWKPGSGPQSAVQSTSAITSYLTDSSTDGSDIMDETNKSETQVIVIETNGCVAEEEVISDNEKQFLCKFCDFSAKTSINLLKHYLNSDKHSNDLFINEIIAKSESNLMKNLSFICQICCFYTNQSNNFFWHLTTSEHSLNIGVQSTHFLCKICDQTCDDVKHLMIHLEDNQLIHTNSSGPLIVCEVNKIDAKVSNAFNKFFDRFECDFCGKVFKFKTHLKKHTISEHIQRVAFPDLIKSNFIGDNPKYSCLKCDFKTDRQSTHLLHSLNHEMPVRRAEEEFESTIVSNGKPVKRNEDKYNCPLCQKAYICRELKQHINTHLECKPFECIECDKSFSKLNYLKIHEKSHYFVIKDKICDICGHSFASNKLLKSHIKTHDVKREKNVGCEVCGTQFYSKFILKAHMKRHLPKSDRQFKCQFSGCRFAFVNISELTEHSKVHSSTEDKPFLCDQCPYKTKSIYSFRKHYRRHTGDYPFKCEFCNFKTNLSSNLVRHSRIHTGAKPYSCPYCSYVCNTQENIRKHILKTKKHNGLYVYPCSHCEHKTNSFIDCRKHLEESHSDLYSNEEIDGLVSHLFRNPNDNCV